MHPTESTGLLGRLADTMFVHRRRVLLTWLIVLVAAVMAALSFGGTYTADYGTPGSDSKAASDRLEQKFAGRSGDAVDVVWTSSGGARAPGVTTTVDRLLTAAGNLEGVVPGTTAADAELSGDGRTAVVRGPLDRASCAVPIASGEELAELVEGAAGGGLAVAVNGEVPGLTPAAGMSAELIGVGIAAVVLLLTFGTVVAAGLPLLVALLGVAVAAMLGALLAAVLDTPDWALQVALMIGIGVGIDYALLILTRYRTAVAGGSTPRQANAVAMSTAGHSVLVAGATVVIALAGLFLMRLPYLYGVALSSGIAVLTVMAATLTLLPALIGLLGRRIDRLQLGRFGRPVADPETTRAARWARGVARRPVIAVVATLLVLGALASPLTGIRFGFPDAGNDAAGTTTREAYDMVSAGFGPGANGPLIAVATADQDTEGAAVQRLVAAVGRDRDVAAVAPPQFNPARDTALIAITPKDSPESPATKELVERLRSGTLARAGIDVSLGGQTASSVDQATVTSRRLPLFIGAVVALSFLLLLAAFRAPVIALKAGLMTVFSIAASYGVVALVAEGGWAGQLVGIDTDLAVPPFIPVMMFAVLFGLSMDYEVFLVSRIKEERERLGDARAAVTVGLARTAKVIMAAALIMVSVFGAFALNPDLLLKLIGIGLASAILIDAVLVRMILVPGLMALLGERAWWTPGRATRRSGELEEPVVIRREPVAA